MQSSSTSIAKSTRTSTTAAGLGSRRAPQAFLSLPHLRSSNQCLQPRVLGGTAKPTTAMPSTFRRQFDVRLLQDPRSDVFPRSGSSSSSESRPRSRERLPLGLRVVACDDCPKGVSRSAPMACSPTPARSPLVCCVCGGGKSCPLVVEANERSLPKCSWGKPKIQENRVSRSLGRIPAWPFTSP